MFRLIGLVTTVAVALSGCARFYEPPMAPASRESAQYESHLTDCREYAERAYPTPEIVVASALLAVTVAAIAAMAACSGGNGTGEALGLAVTIGASAGATAGTVHGWSEQMDAVDRCMRDKGYEVDRKYGGIKNMASSLISALTPSRPW